LKGKPINRGWEVSADELIRIYSAKTHTYETRRLLTDWNPSSKKEIGLVEVLHVYAFTCGGNEAEWTPFLMKGRDVFYKQGYANLGESDRRAVLADLPEFDPDGLEFAEFLYCKVNQNRNWIWGRTGVTNAAFLQSEALRFFQKALLKVSCECPAVRLSNSDTAFDRISERLVGPVS